MMNLGLAPLWGLLGQLSSIFASWAQSEKTEVLASAGSSKKSNCERYVRIGLKL